MQPGNTRPFAARDSCDGGSEIQALGVVRGDLPLGEEEGGEGQARQGTARQACRHGG